MAQSALPISKPRLTHLLSGNYALEPEEISSIRHEIQVIDKIKQAPSKLQHELEAHESKLAECRALLSSLRRSTIPPELLGEIFRLALEGPVSSTLDSDVLVRLCLVCKAWRDVALATPSLWTSVDLKDLTTAPSANKLKTWFLRSGSLPKRLYFDGTDSTGRCNQGEEGCLLSSPDVVQFFANGPTLDEVKLQCARPSCLENLLNLIKRGQNDSRPWDSLRSLKVGFYGWPISSGPSKWALLYSLPPISSLSLNFPRHYVSLLGILAPLPPFDGLTSLTLVCDLPLSWALQSLKNGRNLTTLVLDYNLNKRLRNAGAVHRYERDSNPVFLPRLETLRLRRMINSGDNSLILRKIKTPSLQTLELTFKYNRWSEDMPSPAARNKMELCQDIISLVTGVDGALDLRNLCLERASIPSRGLHDILSALPSLTCLVLDSVETDFALLEKARAAESLLPRLKSLEVIGDKVFNPEEIYAFLRAGDASVENALSPAWKSTIYPPDPWDKNGDRSSTIQRWTC
ncbi:hypothetical protein DFP72DRAFT_1057989 [Ephemerocybe angulata]|uniref:F-box domain-containing protein n=1 Tax=Ephemerocybe angulata TaxID=980116 RepID=A0A8H6IJE0_9AGAR|nr:hypothetical protein DFP72DRAFT_1057989 [Tulosesus angulatus]